MDKIKDFLDREGIKYVNHKNYELPFLHASYTHETPWDDESYERIEFLGDSILGQIVSEYLYKNFPEYNQGDMTLVKHYLVNKEYLSIIGKELKLHELMFLGAGEDRENLSASVFEDVVESLVGAIYLDAGYQETVKFLDKHILSKAKDVSLDDVKDPKTRLQELLQGETRKSVKYETDFGIRDENNTLMFTSKAKFEDMVIGEGKGLNKKEAEKAAAKDAIDRMVK